MPGRAQAAMGDFTRFRSSEGGILSLVPDLCFSGYRPQDLVDFPLVSSVFGAFHSLWISPENELMNFLQKALDISLALWYT